MRGGLFTLFASVILGVWALAFLVSAVTQNYTPFTIATSVMVVITGGVIAYKTPPKE